MLGCEVYVAPGSRKERTGNPSGTRKPYHHLVLLAENQRGWYNLMHLVTSAYLDGFYHRPRIDKELLAAHAEGLIGLSACLSGEVAARLLAGDARGRERAAEEYREILGQRRLLPRGAGPRPDEDESLRRQGIARSRQATGIPVVATNDCHFHRREDVEAHRVLIGIGQNKTLAEMARDYAYNDEFYVKSPAEMARLFGDRPGAHERARARSPTRCHVTFPEGEFYLPRYPVPDGKLPEDYLEELARAGLKQRLADGRQRRTRRGGVLVPPRDRARDHPLDGVRGLLPGGVGLHPLRARARHPGRTGARQRGRLAGGLRPAHHRHRPARVRPALRALPQPRPHLDARHRHRLLPAAARRGDRARARRLRRGERLARSPRSTSCRPARASATSAACMGMSFAETDRIAKLVPDGIGVTLESALQRLAAPRRGGAAGAPTSRGSSRSGRRLEGLARHCGVHAAGVVIAPRPVREIVPLYRTSRDEVVTQFDKDVIEKLGLLKMDFLGLKTLTVIDDCLRQPGGRGIEPPDFGRMTFDDPKVYELFCAGDTDGVFQFESSGMRDLLRTVQPHRFEELAALNALYRPGPMQWTAELRRPQARPRSRSPTSSPSSRRSSPRPTASSSTRSR